VSYLLWQRSGDARIASSRLVLRAAEVPLLVDAQALRDALERLRAEQAETVAAAAARAFEEGLAQGREAGRAQAREELAATLTALAQSAAQERDRLRGEVGALALQVVRKMLGSFAEDAVLAALAAVAANDLVATQAVALVVHPELCQAVRERLASVEAGCAALPCEVRDDPLVPRGCCRIETGHGSVDASLEAQLARLEAAWGQGAHPEGLA
jgi:type III secretion protein L